MKYFFLGILLIGSFFTRTHAQFTRYIIKLKDKNGSPFSLSDPAVYLSQRAIDRRTRYGIAIDSIDLPVNPIYIAQIKNVPNVTLINISNLFNSFTIKTSYLNDLH